MYASTMFETCSYPIRWCRPSFLLSSSRLLLYLSRRKYLSCMNKTHLIVRPWYLHIDFNLCCKIIRSINAKHYYYDVCLHFVCLFVWQHFLSRLSIVFHCVLSTLAQQTGNFFTCLRYVVLTKKNNQKNVKELK